MNGIFWIVLGGMTGWLTGTLMGKEEYGKGLLGGYTGSLIVSSGSSVPLGKRFISF